MIRRQPSQPHHHTGNYYYSRKRERELTYGLGTNLCAAHLHTGGGLGIKRRLLTVHGLLRVLLLVGHHAHWDLLVLEHGRPEVALWSALRMIFVSVLHVAHPQRFWPNCSTAKTQSRYPSLPVYPSRLRAPTERDMRQGAGTSAYAADIAVSCRSGFLNVDSVIPKQVHTFITSLVSTVSACSGWRGTRCGGKKKVRQIWETPSMAGTGSGQGTSAPTAMLVLRNNMLSPGAGAWKMCHKMAK